MQDIKELTLEELESKLISWGQPKYHARQIFAWIYQKGAYEFSNMSNLPVALRKKLAEEFYILGLEIAGLEESNDGTTKFLFKLKDGNFVEAVNIPFGKRAGGLTAPWHKGLPSAPFLGRRAGARRCAVTGCISSQVGCKFSCKFCASGLEGFKRDLSVGEILDEVLYLKNNAQVAGLTHIVFMGTGEPMDNYDFVLKAIRIINSAQGFNIGARRITISTCGIIPGIERLIFEDLQVELSVSLHAADDKLRSQIMPVNKKYPLADLIKCCQDYIAKTNRQITFEYILIKGFNSDASSAEKLISLLKDLRLARVNLIPANPMALAMALPIGPAVGGVGRQTMSLCPIGSQTMVLQPITELKIFPPTSREVLFFKDKLFSAGINVTLRKERGQDINAACGQLRLRHEQE